MIVAGVQTSIGTRAYVAWGNTHAELEEITRRFGYDIIVTSPPWPNYNNGSNGPNSVGTEEWNEVTASLSYLCAHANGVNGLVGIIHMPSTISDRDRDTFEQCLNFWGLQYRILKATSNGHQGRDSEYTWWMIGKKPLTHTDERELSKKIKLIRNQLLIPSRPAARGYFPAWCHQLALAMKEDNHYHADTPERFPTKHLRLMISNMIEPGNTLLDPYAGTGSAMIEAMNAGVHAIGVEIDKYFARATSVMLLREAEATNKTRRSITTTRGTGRSQTAADEYRLSQEQARDQGLYTKKQLISMGIPESQWIPTDYELKKEGGGRRPHLFRIKDFARDQEVEAV